MEALIAEFGSIALGTYGVLAYLGWGLNIPMVKDVMSSAANMFGILSPAIEDPSYDVTTVCLTSFCFAVGSVNLLALKQGAAEKPGARIAREDVNFISYAGLALTHLFAINNGFLSGSFGQFWVTFAIVQAIVHYRIVSSGFGGSARKTMHDNLFKGDTNNLDAVNAAMYVSYGVLFFLAVGLKLEFLQGIAASCMTLFGALGPDPPAFSYDMASIFGGACALGMAGLNVPAFAGAAENSDYADVRRIASIVFWLSSVIGFAALPVNGSFFTFWTAVSAVMAVLLSTKNTTSKVKTN